VDTGTSGEKLESVGICNCGLYICCNLQVVISWELHT
jgi:hypothetical protein